MQEKIRQLFQHQKLAILATLNKDRPYQNIVAFDASADLRFIIFSTNLYTRKYANIKNNDVVSLLIDDRNNMQSDFHRGTAVTAVGQAEELSGRLKKKFLKNFLAKHPYLENFATAPSNRLFSVRVQIYYIVVNFQHVTELHMPL